MSTTTEADSSTEHSENNTKEQIPQKEKLLCCLARKRCAPTEIMRDIERDYIQNRPNLNTYYRTLRSIISNIDVAARATSSGKLSLQAKPEEGLGTLFSRTSKLVDQLTSFLPAIKTVAGLFTTALNNYNQSVAKENLKKLAKLSASVSENDQLFESIGRRLTILSRDYLEQLKPKDGKPVVNNFCTHISSYLNKIGIDFDIDDNNVTPVSLAIAHANLLVTAILHGKVKGNDSHDQVREILVAEVMKDSQKFYTLSSKYLPECEKEMNSQGLCPRATFLDDQGDFKVDREGVFELVDKFNKTTVELNRLRVMQQHTENTVNYLQLTAYTELEGRIDKMESSQCHCTIF